MEEKQICSPKERERAWSTRWVSYVLHTLAGALSRAKTKKKKKEKKPDLLNSHAPLRRDYSPPPPSTQWVSVAVSPNARQRSTTGAT